VAPPSSSASHPSPGAGRSASAARGASGSRRSVRRRPPRRPRALAFRRSAAWLCRRRGRRAWTKDAEGPRKSRIAPRRRYAVAMDAEAVTIAIPGSDAVSGLWQAPAAPHAVLALAHGAGAGMRHKAMAASAEGLVERGVAVLRYQFPYMEKGGKR